MNVLPELKHCVSFFQLVTSNNRALSPKLKTYQQALDLLGSVVDMTALISEQTFFFSSEDEEGRLELLAEIVSVPIETVEYLLIDVSLAIGSIAEKNSQFTHGLALRLSKINKPIGQLTIDGLIEQIDQHTTGFNAIFGGEQ